MVVVLQIIVFHFVYFEYKKDFWRLRNKNFIVYRISLSSSRPKFYVLIILQRLSQILSLIETFFNFYSPAKFCLVFSNHQISWIHVLGVSGVHLGLLPLIFHLDTYLIWFVLQKLFDSYPWFPTEFIEKNDRLNSSAFRNPLTKTWIEDGSTWVFIIDNIDQHRCY